MLPLPARSRRPSSEGGRSPPRQARLARLERLSAWGTGAHDFGQESPMAVASPPLMFACTRPAAPPAPPLRPAMTKKHAVQRKRAARSPIASPFDEFEGSDKSRSRRLDDRAHLLRTEAAAQVLGYGD